VLTKNRLLSRLALWTPPILYMILIFQVSAQSDPAPEVTAHVWDKLLHLAEFGVLGVLFNRAFDGEGAGWRTAAMLALLSTSIYAATDEWHQLFVPLRTSDVHDWMADTSGAALAILLYGLIRLYVGRVDLNAHSLPD
jgi:VanZ family protein